MTGVGRGQGGLGPATGLLPLRGVPSDGGQGGQEDARALTLPAHTDIILTRVMTAACPGPLDARRLRLAALLVSAVLVCLPACDDVPLTAPTESTVTVFINANTVPLNGTADVTASVIEPAGTPVQDGTAVTFTTTLGSFDRVEANTNGGKATVKYLAGSVSGTAKIGAYSGSAKATEVEVKVGGAAATRVTLNASPGSLPSTGGQARLTAVVTDADGNRVPGVAVSFTASAGTLNPATATTDGAGEATSVLTTTRQSDVKATVGSMEATVTVSINNAPLITISAPTSVQALEPVSFSVSVTASGAAISDVRIDFGDGTSESLGRLTGTQATSHAYITVGQYRVTATVTDAAGERNNVSTVVQVLPLQISVSLSIVPTTVQVSTEVRVTVSVLPSYVRVQRYRFEWGDGAADEQTSPTITHRYSAIGLKTITVIVTTSDGQTIVVVGQVSVVL